MFARAGYAVILRDVDERLLDRAAATIWQIWIAKSRKANSLKPKSLHPRAHSAGHRSFRLAVADFVVEAVPERLELKQKVLAEAGSVLRPDAILATNTSSISITALAAPAAAPIALSACTS